MAIALPWLEIMQPPPASAVTAGPKRFIAVYTPGGTVLENWRPQGTPENFTFGPILTPLASQQSRLIVLDGLDMPSAIGEQNQAGLIALLTGSPQKEFTQFATGPSLDQVLVRTLSNGFTLPSLELAVRWGTGKSHGLLHPTNILTFLDDREFTAVPPRLDPVDIYEKLFGKVPSTDETRTWDKSILDAVDKRYVKLAARLGREDRARLEQHLSSIRELEQQLAQLPPRCAAPTLVDTSDYNPQAGLGSDDVGSVKDPATDAAIPKVGKLMMDMMVMALACDLTPIASLMWSDTEAKHTLPWLGLNEHVHYYMNDGGYQPTELTKIFTWYCEQHAYLLKELQRIQIGERTLLDETLVFFGSHLQHPATHAKTDMPFLLAGGGIRGGQWLDCGHRSHNDLLVAMCNLLGDRRTTFGDARFCTGALGGLS